MTSLDEVSISYSDENTSPKRGTQFRCFNVKDKNHVTFSCERCGKRTRKDNRSYYLATHHYCGNLCARGANKGLPSLKNQTFVCPVCSRKFLRYISNARAKNPCCSISCASSLKAVRGEKSRFYVDGKTPFHQYIRCSKAYLLWVKTVKQRDGYHCVECGSNGEIQVHHLIPFQKLLKQFLKDNVTLDTIRDRSALLRLSRSYLPFWDLSNGITLCLSCHEKKHPHMKIRRLKLGTPENGQPPTAV